ncbi:MAG: hypothetical protein LBS97_06555, partial [Treponema sp.]|nr:hypothetical protein [Treponema sp.]
MKNTRPFLGLLALLPALIVLILMGCTDPNLSMPIANSTVTGVTISPAAADVAKGGTATFGAVVAGTNNPAQTVTWFVSGGSSGTAISAGGILAVAADETAAALTVTATSTVDTAKSGSAAVTVAGNTDPDTRVTLGAGSPVNADAADTTATVSFTSASGLTLTTADFAVNNGATVTGVDVAEDAATVSVGFAANTAATAKTYTVSIASGSTLIKGTAAVVITQGATAELPTLTGTVSISGAAQVGQTLTA